MQRVSSIAAISVLLAGCARGAPAPPAAEGAAPHSASKAAAGQGVAPSASASSSATPPAPASPPVEAPMGTVRVVVQHVEAVCSVGVGANGKGHFTIGKDLLLEITPEGAAKPSREHVFCPRTLPDGGVARPQLGIWQNCRRTPVCKIISEVADGGPADRVEVECGNDWAILERSGARTILRSSLGEREIAPFPMRIAPTKRERRDAWVDC